MVQTKPALSISLNVFVWESRTDQCRFTHCFMLSSGPRGISRPDWLVGGQGLGVFFFSFFLFTAMLSGWSGCWESSVQAAKPAVTQQGIDWIISVSSDSNVAYTGPLLRATQLLPLPGKSGLRSYREEIKNLFVNWWLGLFMLLASRCVEDMFMKIWVVLLLQIDSLVIIKTHLIDLCWCWSLICSLIYHGFCLTLWRPALFALSVF